MSEDKGDCLTCVGSRNAVHVGNEIRPAKLPATWHEWESRSNPAGRYVTCPECGREWCALAYRLD